MKKVTKVLLTAFVFVMIFGTAVFADYDPIQNAASWWVVGPSNLVTGNNGVLSGLNGGLLRTLTNLINVVGTAIISIVAVILGIKYMIGSAADKSSVKEQLITFLVACVFFFGWSNLSGLLITGTTYDPSTGTYSGISGATQLFVFNGLQASGGFTALFARIFAIVVFFGKIIALIATMYIGVKYIFSGADAKAELKQRGPRYIIGILLIFCTLNILSFVSQMINQALIN